MARPRGACSKGRGTVGPRRGQFELGDDRVRESQGLLEDHVLGEEPLEVVEVPAVEGVPATPSAQLEDQGADHPKPSSALATMRALRRSGKGHRSWPGP
jgi:hypothetical protein